jgi:hypothetical protein
MYMYFVDQKAMQKIGMNRGYYKDNISRDERLARNQFQSGGL